MDKTKEKFIFTKTIIVMVSQILMSRNEKLEMIRNEKFQGT